MSIDIFSIPLYYISFKRNKKLETYLRNFKFKNINHFKSINGRKMKLTELLKQNKITARVYNDISFGRHEHSGFPGMGGIGCTMSHYEIWKKCVEKNLPYIIIVEDDVVINKPLTDNDINKITEIISKPNGVFIGTYIYIDNGVINFQGTQFGIYSQSACKELIKRTYPIDIQVDHYIAYLNNIKNVNVEGYNLASQSIHPSSIQDLCIKCMLPQGNLFYIILILIILIFIIYKIVVKFVIKKKYNCKMTTCRT